MPVCFSVKDIESSDIQQDLVNLPHQNTAVAIGNFDGVHLGHQSIIKHLKLEAEKRNLIPSVLSFNPHPRAFFEPQKQHFSLINITQKESLLNKNGIGKLYLICFDKELSELSPESFIEKILVNGLKSKLIFVGEDFRFGKNRQGDITLLKKYCAKRGIEVFSYPLIKHNDKIISSSRIREALKNGKPEIAMELLGRAWCFESIVQHGDKRGRDLGFPTANLKLAPEIIIREGVYTVKATIIEGNQISLSYGGVASYGRRPVFDNGQPLFEIYLFDFNSNIYGKKLCVELLEYQRAELNFNSVEELIAQMKKDKLKAQNFLRNI